TPHQGCIAHGLLTLSMTTGLLFRLGQGEGTLLALGELRARFVAPVKAGDAIRATVTVVRKRKGKKGWGVVERRCEVFNQRAETVLDCTLVGVFARREA